MQTKLKNIITLHSLGSNEFSSISFVRIFLSGEKKMIKTRYYVLLMFQTVFDND